MKAVRLAHAEWPENPHLLSHAIEVACAANGWEKAAELQGEGHKQS